MPNLNFNPDKDIPDLAGKSIFITGGQYIPHLESAFRTQNVAIGSSTQS